MDDKFPEMVYAIADGEPWLSQCKAYKEAYNDSAAAWSAYCEKIGADQYWHGGMFRFPRGVNPPEGWTKRNRSHGTSKPMVKNKEAWEEIKALPIAKVKDFFDLSGLLFNFSYSYTHPDFGPCNGNSSIGRFYFDPIKVGWCEDTYYLLIPHAANAAKNFLLAYGQYEDAQCDEAARHWTAPEGLRVVFKEEIDILHASHRLNKKQK